VNQCAQRTRANEPPDHSNDSILCVSHNEFHFEFHNSNLFHNPIVSPRKKHDRQNEQNDFNSTKMVRAIRNITIGTATQKEMSSKKAHHNNKQIVAAATKSF
jgi:hypothetical protein